MPSVSSSAIADLLGRAAALRPEGWAVRDPQVACSYPELVALAESEAGQLAAAGLGPGGLVLLEAVHGVEYLVSYFAALSLGCHVMPWDSAATRAEAERETARYGVEFTLRCGPEPAAERLRCTGAVGRGPRPADEALVLLPTSGTGGMPKRAVHRERRLVANAGAHAASVGFGADDVCLVSLSPAFGYCHTAQILTTVAAAGRLVFPPRPALPGQLGRIVEEFGVTTTTMVPHQMSAPMMRALGRGGSLRQLVLGGSAVGDELAGRIAESLPGVEMVQTWGMTEAGPRLTTWRGSRDRGRPGSVGLPLDGVRIVAADRDGALGLPGLDVRVHPGELVALTPYLMSGYLDAPEETAAAVLAPDVLRTGDVGRVDADGYVHVTGRVKNLIDVSGKKVSPEEIESVLLTVEGVAEARVYAEPVADRGERPAAQVVAAPGAALEPDRVADALRTLLARHKWPGRIDVVDRLDRTPNGKIRRW